MEKEMEKSSRLFGTIQTWENVPVRPAQCPLHCILGTVSKEWIRQLSVTTSSSVKPRTRAQEL